MPQLIPYGAAVTLRRPLMLAGAYLTSSPTIAAGDYNVSQDGGTYGALDTTPTWTNDEINLPISAAEATCARGSIRIHDAAGGEFDDDTVKFETYGHPLSAHPTLGEPLGVAGEVDDASATTTVFVGASGLSTTDDFYNGALVVFQSGALAGVARPIVDYDGSGLAFTVAPALPSAPADNVRFLIVGRG